MGSQHLTPEGYTAVACYLGFLLLAGILTQTITIKVLLLRENRKKHLTPYLLNIVVSNIVVILGSFPTTFVSSLKNKWIFNDAVCRLNGLLTGIGCTAMIATMTCITVKIHSLVKNQNVVANQITLQQNEQRPYVKILTAIWIYSFIAMVPPIAGLTDMVLEAAETNCVPVWAPERVIDKIYIICLTILAYVLPVAISLVYLWKTRLALSMHISIMNNRFMNIRLGNLRNIYRMSTSAVLFFTLVWLPYAVYVLVSLISGENVFSVELMMVPVLTAKTSVIINPFIYAIVIPRFRDSVLRILGIKRNIGRDTSDICDLVSPLARLPASLSLNNVQTIDHQNNRRSNRNENRRYNNFFSITNETEIVQNVEFNRYNSKDSELNETRIKVLTNSVKPVHEKTS